MKEEMSSFDIAALIPEIRPLVIGARLDNIYQINSATLLLRLRARDGAHQHLVAEAGRRIHLTSYALERLPRLPAFCTALRRHLGNGRVTEVQQHGFDRTVVVEVTTGLGAFRLVIELFGGGNIILVSPEDRILQALHYRRMRDRSIRPGETFRFAPSRGRNPLELEPRDLEGIRGLGDAGVARALPGFLGIGGLYAEEVLLRAQVEKDTPCRLLTEDDIQRVFDCLREVLSAVAAGRGEPTVVLDEGGEWIDVTPIPLRRYSGLSRKSFRSFNEALDEYYTRAGVRERAAEATREAEEKMAEQSRILRRQREALQNLKVGVEENRRIGDLIYAHLHELQSLLERITEEKGAGKPWEDVASTLLSEGKTGRAPAMYFRSLEPKGLALRVTVEGVDFSLSLRRPAQASAAQYYERAKRAGRKLGGAERALGETRARIEGLQSRAVERPVERPGPPARRRRRAWYEKFRWFLSSDGLLVVGGRDAATNEALVKGHMEPQDVVLHAEVHGAPFVLIKTGGRPPPERTIREAAQLAASYSRAWREALASVDVYWVHPHQVGKSPPSGQYLAKGAFTVSGPRNRLRGIPLGAAVGLKEEGDHLVVIGGPPEAVLGQTEVCVEVAPGNKSSGELAKKIRGLLAERAPEALRKRILDLPLEEIQAFIPPGGGKVKLA